MYQKRPINIYVIVRPSKEHYNVAASFDIGTYWSLLMDLHSFYALLLILQCTSVSGWMYFEFIALYWHRYLSVSFDTSLFYGCLFYGSLLTILWVSFDHFMCLSIHESPCRFWYCIVVCCSMLMYVIIQKDWGRVSFDTLLTLTNRTEGKGRE